MDYACPEKHADTQVDGEQVVNKAAVQQKNAIIQWVTVYLVQVMLMGMQIRCDDTCYAHMLHLHMHPDRCHRLSGV
jgi:hypothetical protein